MENKQDAQSLARAATAWWATDIIEMEPGSIRMRGYAIENLIGNISFPQMIWLMLRGELPQPGQAKLLEAALVSAVDHGPQAPSIAIARMAATCGIGINGAMASAINALGDVHGGAGQQCMNLYADVAAVCETGVSVDQAARRVVERRLADAKFLPGFGHRFHPVDPRSGRLLELVEQARKDSVVEGRYMDIAIAITQALASLKNKSIPMNIDGATAVIYAELGFVPELARGLFILSRSVGILAHAWEQTGQGGRIKGPMPPSVPYTYTGPAPREL